MEESTINEHAPVTPPTLKTTNYYRIYQTTPSHPSLDSILDGLSLLPNTDFYRAFCNLSETEQYSLSDRCIICWSKEEPKFYSVLKRVIASDSPTELQHWMPFIRALTRGVTLRNYPKQMVTYRGYRRPNLPLISSFVVGGEFRIPHFVATSLRHENAMKFGYVVEFVIPPGCPNARDISHLSDFPEEEEVLLPPYTLVRVLQNDTPERGSLVLQVLDNRSVSSSIHPCYSLDDPRRKEEEVVKSTALLGGFSGAVFAGAPGAVLGSVAGALLGGVLGALNSLTGTDERKEGDEYFDKFCD